MIRRFGVSLLFLGIMAGFIPLGSKNSLVKIAKEASDSIPSLGSILVFKNNDVVCEAYFNGADSNTQFNVKSVTKTVISMLAGAAHDRKLLPGVNTAVLDVLPEYSNRVSDTAKQIKIKDVLTMRLGVRWNDFEPTFWRSNDGIKDYLEAHFEAGPGKLFRYSTPAGHLMGVVVAKCVKTDLETFADTVLFAPLGIKIARWPKDKMGRANGGSELHLRSRDLVKLGCLFLNQGKVNGKQVISEAWVKESTDDQVGLTEWDVLPDANGYGYYWWRRKALGHQAWVASGYGGQLICVIPDLEMVVVTTCHNNEKNRGRSEIKRLHGFIDKIVKAVS